MGRVADNGCRASLNGLLKKTIAIDALAAGVSFAAMQVQILPAVALIGVITCCLSAAGVKTGNVFGMRYKAMAERAGGAVLVLMGLKILLEGLGWL